MPLTAIAVKNAKPEARPKKLYDERGLHLHIAPSGGKWWRLRYRHGGKEKLISLGVYPEISLSDARERRDEARRQLANGIDPSQHREATKTSRVERAANSFEVIAREWFAGHEATWARSHSEKIMGRMVRDIFPFIGGRPIAEITAAELLPVLRKIEERGTRETAHRALADCGRIFRYAVSTARAERNIAADLKGALSPAKGGHFAAVTDPKKVGGLLRMLHQYEGGATVTCALRLAPLVIVRPGELRTAKWADINLEAAEWSFTVSKTGTPHIVPLATQAVELLRELHPLTGDGIYVFPSALTKERPMSDNAILAAMRRLGIPKDEMSGHGFRAMARTILDEVLGVKPELIEHQLAHAVKDANGRAYNRTTHLPERREMMQKWADYLYKLKDGVAPSGVPSEEPAKRPE